MGGSARFSATVAVLLPHRLHNNFLYIFDDPLLLLVKLNKLFLSASAEMQLDVEVDGELKREEDEGSIAQPGRRALRSDSGLPD